VADFVRENGDQRHGIFQLNFVDRDSRPHGGVVVVQASSSGRRSRMKRNQSVGKFTNSVTCTSAGFTPIWVATRWNLNLDKKKAAFQ
jgi:hypothetical protein